MPAALRQKQHLRRRARASRRSISNSRQALAAASLKQHLLRRALLHKSKTIAFYMARDGELSLTPLLSQCARIGKRCYLPVVDGPHLYFVRYRIHDATQMSDMQITEPTDTRERISATDLDLVFVPLVAFDCRGHRLGMGGGYYDRSFASVNKTRRQGRKPVLCGIAHTKQRRRSLPRDHWDVRMQCLATERSLISF